MQCCLYNALTHNCECLHGNGLWFFPFAIFALWIPYDGIRFHEQCLLKDDPTMLLLLPRAEYTREKRPSLNSYVQRGWGQRAFKRWRKLFFFYSSSSSSSSASLFRFVGSYTTLCAFRINGIIYIEMRKFVLFNSATTNGSLSFVNVKIVENERSPSYTSRHYKTT